jgi:hypothetical protein
MLRPTSPTTLHRRNLPKSNNATTSNGTDSFTSQRPTSPTTLHRRNVLRFQQQRNRFVTCGWSKLKSLITRSKLNRWVLWLWQPERHGLEHHCIWDFQRSWYFDQGKESRTPSDGYYDQEGNFHQYNNYHQTIRKANVKAHTDSNAFYDADSFYDADNVPYRTLFKGFLENLHWK